MTRHDVIVVGSGVAGLTTTIELAAAGRRVLLLTTGELGSGSTGWAQGGIAAAVGTDDDPAQHASDTLIAGAGHGDPITIELLTEAAPERLGWLLGHGAQFDRRADGQLALGREGGHHRSRVAHAGGDATGAEVRRILVAVVRRLQLSGLVQILEHSTLREIAVTPDGTVAGVVVSHGQRAAESIPAAAVVLATGGAGGLWPTTTNPDEISGAGLAAALRAGAALADLEFVQFHPTALAVGPASRQRPLVTEALRGAGALLIDADGNRLMVGVHPLADLAPRDVVARTIFASLRDSGRSAVGLDATELGRERLMAEFPTVWAACIAADVDPSTTPIPVAPAQHFLCGGIDVDADGATDVPGLFAVGEAAATGVHGANRLASNSLLEGLVFGRRVADRLASMPLNPTVLEAQAQIPVDEPADLDCLRSVMGAHVGLLRTAAGLGEALTTLARLRGDQALAAHAISLAALQRDDSRGCHWRADHPSADPRWDASRVVVRLEGGELRTRVERTDRALPVTA